MRYRSDCGPDDHWNLTTLCYVHHDLVHGSIQSIAVSGSAPDELLWEIGRRPRKPPLIVFRSYRRVPNPEARALVPVMRDGAVMGTIIVSVIDAVFDAKNDEHVKVAREIETRLVSNDWLPTWEQMVRST